MAWKSRTGKNPPARFFADIARHLALAYPSAEVSKALMLRLRPRMVMAWQEGTSAKATAESTCACDGKKVVPSPPTEVQLLKAEVRPPVGAQRGDVFGVEELRESVVISNLRRGVERLREQSRRAKERADVATTSLAKARAESVRTTARTRQIKALQEYRELLTEQGRMEQSLRQAVDAQESERSRLMAETKAMELALSKVESRTLTAPVTAAPKTAKRGPAAAKAATVKPAANAAKTPQMQAAPAGMAAALKKMTDPKAM
jgi:hypothetical protein